MPLGNDDAQSAKLTKSARRREIITRRRAMGVVARQRASALICQKIIARPEYAAAQTLAAFAPMAEEVNIWDVLNHALAAGKTVALPRIDDFSARRMTFHRLHRREELQISGKGIAEPPPQAPIIKFLLFDFLLIPAVGGDLNGNRLGYGGGFYDIFLSRQENTFSCAPVFQCQFVTALPTERHDKTINLFITEKQ